jgi:1,4-dihydroxy-2-naphthoate octaprenyltransferase
LFLVGGFVLYGLGAAIAVASGGAIDMRRYVLGQAVVTAFQLMTHYANDYFDYETDRANTTPTAWSGGSRVLTGEELPRVTALIASVVVAAIGVAIAFALAWTVGWIVLPAAAAMLVLSWEYSAPPLRLCAHGAGELDTAVVVTGIVPCFAFWLQRGDDVGMLIAAIVPLACLQAAMLVAIEFPDARSDAATGKRTLVVTLGPVRAARLYVALTALAYIALAVGALTALPGRIAVAAASTLPVAAWRIARTREHRDPRAWERTTRWAVALLVVTSAAELAATLSLQV